MKLAVALEVEPFESLWLGLDPAFELQVANLFKDLGKLCPGLEPETHQVVARNQRRRVDRPGRLDLQIVITIVYVLGIARRRQRISPVKRQQLVDPRFRQDPFELRLAQFLGPVQKMMKSNEPIDTIAFRVREFQVAAKPARSTRAPACSW